MLLFLKMDRVVNEIYFKNIGTMNVVDRVGVKHDKFYIGNYPNCVTTSFKVQNS